MLEQFRNLYPQGSLISDLIAIDHGKYIVRALIQVDGIILATALAAADTVEKAEDQARIRVFALLNFSKEAGGRSQKSEVGSQESEVGSQESGVEFSPSPPVPSNASRKKKEQKSSPSPEENPSPSLPLEIIPQEPLTKMLTCDPDPEPLMPESKNGLSATYEEESLPLDEEPELTLVEPVAVNLETPDLSAEAEAMDFDEVINRSNLELKRLKWTNEQGRNYLLQTYGKRSRHLLSDEELLEFLRYLESQPNP